MKKVLILGGASGLGGALTLQLLGMNYDVHVLGRKTIPGASHIACDLASEEQVNKLLHSEVLEAPQFQWVILNAGIGMRSPFNQVDLDSLMRMIKVNFGSQVAILRKLVTPYLDKLINISSVQASFAMRSRSLYCASKGGMQLLIEALQLEEQKTQTYNIILGYMKTNLSHNSIGPNGQRFSKTDKNQENGLLPEKVSSIIIRKVLKNKGGEICIAGLRERLALFLFRYFRPVFLILRKVMQVSS